MAVFNNKLNDGAIDSTDTVFLMARSIVPYVDNCISVIEAQKPGEDCKGAALQTFNAYKKGLLEAYRDIKEKVTKSGFPGAGGVIVHEAKEPAAKA